MNSDNNNKVLASSTPQLPEYPKSASNADMLLKTSNVSITEKLEKALHNTAPFLKDIFIEFSQLLSKIIVGSHGQELITSGLSALKQSSSVIELVMLLCSQEWQTSLQKHAGLSFIELVNEGRLLAHASKDHIVRVANEADFILNRMRADDVKKHAEFEQLCAQTTMERKEEEVICEHLISAARKRDHYYAIKLRDKILNLITDKQGCWYDLGKHIPIYWKLDNWEDDIRRRRRFVKNPNGSSHPEAALKASMDLNTQDAINQKDELLKQLNSSKRFMSEFQNAVANSEQLSISETELEQELAGPIHYTTKCKLVCSVCVVSGTLSITSNELYFEVDEADPAFKTLEVSLLAYADNLHGKWHFNEIRAIFSRRYMLQNIALEIFVANRSNVMFAFTDRRTVEKVVNILPRVGVGPRYGLPQARHTSLASPQQLFRSSNMTQKWQRREISNFDYLMYLNTIAGRTYNDLNQYLIFPWVLINYESATIDLNSPSSYRDLSKPIGALNPSRRQFFVERYQNWDSSSIPPFHYGTHYSTAAFTLNWLVRVEPFTSIFLNLQDGRFDHADRTFHSLATSWKNCQRDTSDVKELTPEFYYLPEMFLNLNKYKLGATQDKHVVDDVELPKWAKNAHDFVRINRMALESEFVSCQLHQWIDLIFGYKQRGPEAIRNCNVFYYLTYEGAVNLESIDDQITKQAVESQIKNFGQTPSQLLTEPHPPRSSPLSITPMMFTQHNEDVCMIMKFFSNAPVIFVSANTGLPSLNAATVNTAQFQQSIVTISSKHEFSINKYNPSATQASQASAINNYNAYNEASNAGGAQATSSSSNASINSQGLQNPINANQTSQMQQQLPVQMDQLLAFNTALHRRQLGENFDDKLQLNQNNFIVTYDNKFILATGFFDKSFRVFNTDTAKIVQIVFGHYDLVTCISRSEMTQNGNCFVATGSRDSTIMIWIWNGQKGLIVNKDLSTAEPEENPSPGAILTGHIRQIVGVVVSSELGLVISASQQGPILVHTVYGDLLRQFEPNVEVLDDPTQLFMLQDAENVCVVYKNNNIAFFTLNGTQLNHIRIEEDSIHVIIFYSFLRAFYFSSQLFNVFKFFKAVTMSQDGQYLIIGGEKGTVYVYRAYDLSLAYTYPSCDAIIKSLAVTHDQKYVFVKL
jgi:WD40 repeat protein